MNKNKYMNLISCFACALCGKKPVQVHHPKAFGCGAGQKCSDFLTIPLCKEHHDEIHKHYNINGKDEADLLAETIQAVVQKLSNDRIPF